MDKIIEQQINKLIDKRLSKYAQNAFTNKQITDTPTGGFDLVNRNFITANGITASRPTNPVTGQMFYDTTLVKPIWWNGSVWKDATGTTV